VFILVQAATSAVGLKNYAVVSTNPRRYERTLAHHPVELPSQKGIAIVEL